MNLSGVQQAGKPGYPWLVFLHGFSGDCREWQKVGEKLSDYPPAVSGICRVTVDPEILA